jgi:hypothetical protein
MRESTQDALHYLLYDSEQSTKLNLTEYIAEINRAITSTGAVAGGYVENTFDRVNWYTYESKAYTDEGFIGTQGNLTFRKYNGQYSFMASRTDPADQWTNMSVTYNLYDKARAGDAKNWAPVCHSDYSCPP